MSAAMETSSDSCIEGNWRQPYQKEGDETLVMQAWQRSKEGLKMGILMMLQSSMLALERHCH